MKAIVLKGFGGVDNLAIEDVPKPHFDSKQDVDKILIRVHAAGVNRADIMQRMGKYPPPKGESEILGLEVCGTIEDVGENVKDYKKGERVGVLLAGGGYAQYVVVDSGLAIPIPSHLSDEEGAAIPEAYLTAFQALTFVANLRDGNNLLIHAGASGVGLAAIQIAKKYAKNTKVIVTVGSEEKKQFCVGKMGADVAINYKEHPQFSKSVLEATNQSGVDILIDFIGGSYWTENLQSLADDGTMVMLGSLGGGSAPAFDASQIMRRRLQIKGSTLRARPLEYKRQLVKTFSKFLLSEGDKSLVVHPTVSRVFDWKQVADAHHFMEQNQNIGKIILNNIQN